MFVAVLEIGTRVFMYCRSDVITSSPDIFYFDTKPALRYGSHGDLVPGESLWMVSQWRPYKVTVNRQGLRSAVDTGPGAVLAVGDSFTFGAYVDNEDTWPAQLEGFLVRRNPDRAIAVGNAGIAGYGIVQEFAYLREKGLRLRPGLVVLGFNPNDIGTDMWPERLARIRRPRDEAGFRSHCGSRPRPRT